LKCPGEQIAGPLSPVEKAEAIAGEEWEEFLNTGTTA